MVLQKEEHTPSSLPLCKEPWISIALEFWIFLQGRREALGLEIGLRLYFKGKDSTLFRNEIFLRLLFFHSTNFEYKFLSI